MAGQGAETLDPTGTEKIPASTCSPGGAVPATLKPYWYIVQPEDINAFWNIPSKFNLPTQKGTAWTWQELRNANLDWPGGFTLVNSACVLQGLFAGAKLSVPGDWPEPRPGVKTETKPPSERRVPTKGTATAALIVAGIGIVGIAGLAWLASRSRRTAR